MAAFFIKRPIFATVIALIIMLSGGLCLRTLSVAQYPDIALPQIGIIGQYPGASAKVVDESVTQVIEQQMKGIDNLIYMRSSSDSMGNIEMYFTFEAGTNIDIAQVQVQNKLSQANPMLPEAVQRQGLYVYKSVDNSFMTIAFYSEGDTMRANDISDYVASSLLEPLSRVQGVGSTTLYGGQNAMRVWLDPIKMRQYNLNPSDVSDAIKGQNAQVAGGQVGAAPAPPGQEVSLTVNAGNRLTSIKEFEDIIIRTEPDGSNLRIKDVARVELNEESFLGRTWYNGHEGVGIAVKLASGANVLDTTRGLKSELENLSRYFPPGLKYAYADDRAPIVEKSVAAVVRTLFEAILLVVVVMYIFLQNLRATLIPTIAVPVVLLGVFAVLAAAGFSINTLTMFGLVLAIGLLVDDAIVVVENVERLMRDEGMSPLEASFKSMEQITGALVGVAVVISAVFLPMAFMQGSTGVIYRQFSITIVSAMVLSVIVAIVLSPALCAILLKRHDKPREKKGLFHVFNEGYRALAENYKKGVVSVLHAPRKTLAVFVAALVASGWLFHTLPTAFLPDEDQGVLYIDVNLPPGASFERTEAVMHKIENYFMNEEAESVKSVMSVMGWSFSGSGQASGMLFPTLKDWSERGDGQGAFDIMNRANAYFAANIPEASIFVMAPPAVMELGNSSGFDMQLMDRGSLGHEALMAAKNQLLEKASEHPEIAEVRYSGQEDNEQYDLSMDVAKAGALGLTKAVINNAVGTYWGGEYVNDFADKGRTKKVYLQAEPAFRDSIRDFDEYYLRNSDGAMVPLSSFIKASSVLASPKLTRYQGVPAVKIEGTAAAGVSSGTVMSIMEQEASSLPSGFDFAWSGLSYQEQKSGQQAPFLYSISLIVVFLALAALYESWSIPLAVLLSVPTGLIGALVGMHLRGMNNDIYFQIAMLTIVGLSAKNSILIVEFARNLHREGKSLMEATIEAARLRLRPILMTSLCFILGVVPLTISHGAGSGAQNALGTAVMTGMISATGLGIFFTPLFFYLVTKLFTRRSKQQNQDIKIS